MSAVNESIVREFFESVGFLVRQPNKYTGPSRRKRAEEKIDFIVVNPSVAQQAIPADVVWTAGDLKGIARAIVGVRGWHTERFYTQTFEQNPELLDFADEKSMAMAAGMLGTRDIARILCIPDLPASVELKDRTLNALKGKGVDGVLPFRTILVELLGRVDSNRNYDKSDILQVLRILKNYGLIKDAQLDLFAKARKHRKPAAAG